MSTDAISSLISSLLPIVITLFFAWISSRNELAKRQRIVEDAKKRIELISAYITSQSLVLDDPDELGAIKKTAANELYAIKAFLDNKLQSLEKSSEKSEHYFQHFFLLYKMQTRLAGFFRACFFFVLLISVFLLYGTFLGSFTPEYVQENGLGSIILGIIIFVVLPSVLIVLLFRWLAIKYDKPVNSNQMAESSQ
jgi:hypothetical protein